MPCRTSSALFSRTIVVASSVGKVGVKPSESLAYAFIETLISLDISTTQSKRNNDSNRNKDQKGAFYFSLTQYWDYNCSIVQRSRTSKHFGLYYMSVTVKQC